MRVMVIGGQGMLGHKMVQVLSGRFETWATFRDASGPWRRFPMYVHGERTIGGVDALNFASVVGAFARARPEVVVNCAGVVKQLPEAQDPILTLRTNALFPHELSRLCTAAAARLVHISTDCVFSGRRGGYSEDDSTDAEDLYGRTKALGEVRADGVLTLRTSIIGRDFLRDTSLVEWFLAQRGGRVRGYVNAIFSGLPTAVLSAVVADLIADHRELAGIYQVVASPISKYELLTKLNRAFAAGVEIERHEGEPCDRSLDGSKLRRATGFVAPDWDDLVSGMARDPTPYESWRQRHAV